MIDGFNEAFTFPNFEDRELGARLNQHGITCYFVPELQVTHLKRHSIWSLIKDTFQKAWRNTRPELLRLRFRQDFLYDTNHVYQFGFYLRTLLAPLLAASLIVAFVGWRVGWWLLVVGSAAYLVSIAGLLRFSFKLWGLTFTLRCLFLSFPEQFAAFAGGLIGIMSHLLKGRLDYWLIKHINSKSD